MKSYTGIFMLGAALFSNISLAGVDNILSMQIREDKNFNAICVNKSIEVITKENILSNDVCLPSDDGCGLQEGTYSEMTHHLCDQKVRVTCNGNHLKSMRLEFPGCYGEYFEGDCADMICEGSINKQNIRVTVVSATQYNWENLSVPSTGRFIRTGNLNKYIDPSTPNLNSGIAGQR